LLIFGTRRRLGKLATSAFKVDGAIAGVLHDAKYLVVRGLLARQVTQGRALYE
jgi:hypothetical protein